MRAARTVSLMTLGEAAPGFLAVGMLMLVISLGVSTYYFYPDPPRHAWQLLLISQALLAALGAMAGQSGLNSLLRLLQARVAPLGALEAALPRLRRAALLFWLLAAAPLLIIGGVELEHRSFDSRSDALDWFTAGPALLALLMMGCATVTASWQGRMPLAAGGAAVLLLGLTVAMGWGRWAEAWIAAGWPVHLASILLLWPAVRLLLRVPAVTYRSADRSSLGWWRKGSAAWQRYWYFIDPNTRGGLPLVFWVLPLQFPAWGEPLGLQYLIRFSLLVLFAGLLLQSRDLHWRRLLAPGGARRQNLGLRIALHSLQGLLLIAIVGSLAYIPIAMGFALWTGRSSMLEVLVLIPSTAGSLVCELTLATVIAAILRGLTNSHRISAACGLLVMLLFISLPWWNASLQQISWTHGPAHNAILLGLSLALLPVLQRAWRNTDLTQLASQARAIAEPGRQSALYRWISR